MKKEIGTAFLLILGFLVVQFIPSLEPFIVSHPHLVALADAIVSAIAVWIATSRNQVKP